MIIDSGERRKFESGAVRDIAEGKGRCDLLPLDVVARFLYKIGKDPVTMVCIASYIYSGEKKHLLGAIESFCMELGTLLLSCMWR